MLNTNSKPIAAWDGGGAPFFSTYFSIYTTARDRDPLGGSALKNQFSLSSLRGEVLALKLVHLAGRVDELLMTMTMSQHYVNDSDENVEIIYT